MGSSLRQLWFTVHPTIMSARALPLLLCPYVTSHHPHTTIDAYYSLAEGTEVILTPLQSCQLSREGVRTDNIEVPETIHLITTGI